MRITILGCGNIGTAYARGFRKYGLVGPDDLHLVVRDAAHAARIAPLGQVSCGIDERLSRSDVVIIAVKPQDFGTVAPVLAEALRPGQVVLSIMAGITLERLRTGLRHATIVRAMPNAPARVGMGITAYTACTELNMRQTLMIEQLLSCTGRTVHLADEALLDPVTALSGSGPAYFFELVRAMIASGVRLGLEPHVASALVKQTMLGSYLLMEGSDTGPEELIRMVMSKGGTTEAAFRVFSERDLAGTVGDAIGAANERAKELSGA